MTTRKTTDSAFERIFEVAVCGAGFTGFAAARQLAAAGHSVILIESSGALLWEGSRALANSAEGGGPAWRSWLQAMKVRQGANDRFFDPVLAEIVAADELQRSADLQTLFYAPLVQVHQRNRRVHAVTVATKNGARSIRARRWVDATETGALLRLANPGIPPVRTSGWRCLVLQSTQWAAASAGLAAFRAARADCRWQESVRVGERRLYWPAASAESDPTEARAILGELRSFIPETSFGVSQASMKDYPILAAPSAVPGIPENVIARVPAFANSLWPNPGDRFEWGHAGGERLAEIPVSPDAEISILRAFPAPTAEVTAEVLVAGAGTAGAIAALAAARQGATTVVLESGYAPGGIGTEGGITGYFHGAKGGLFEEVDALTRERAKLLTGRPGAARWHHEAKKQALSHLLNQSGARLEFETLLCGVESDEVGRVRAVLAAREGQLIRYAANAFIDSTGDGDLCALAGADFTMGRAGDQRCLAFSQPSFYLAESEESFNVATWNFDAGWVDATDPEDLSRARLRGAALYLRDDWTEKNRPFALAPLLGLRQSRQISAEAELGLQGLVEHRKVADSIGETAAVLDTHSVDFEFESDETLFYLWVCRSFRHSLHAELSYRMLLPRGLANVWIACRAAGISPEAAYSVRMQRDMQRIGEAAGIAAAWAAKAGTDSRKIDLPRLQSALIASGAKRETAGEMAEARPATDPLAQLDSGRSATYLWLIYRDPSRYRSELLKRLPVDGAISFYAAAVLAMWGDSEAEPRLLRALESREIGPDTEERSRGAFAQIVDIPFWAIAINLLRMNGTAQALTPLRAVLAENQPFNLRTMVALTLERLVQRIGWPPEAEMLLGQLEEGSMADAFLPPSRSLWLTLRGEPPKVLPNQWGADARVDHSGQMAQVLTRIRALRDRSPRNHLVNAGAAGVNPARK